MSELLSVGISKNSMMMPYNESAEYKTAFSLKRSIALRCIQFLTRYNDLVQVPSRDNNRNQGSAGDSNYILVSAKDAKPVPVVIILVQVEPVVSNLVALMFPSLQFISYGYKNPDNLSRPNLQIMETYYTREHGRLIMDANPTMLVSILDFISPGGDISKFVQTKINDLRELNPFMSSIMLKLPYPTNTSEEVDWIKGEHYWPCWNSSNSSVVYFTWIRKNGFIPAKWNLSEYEKLSSYQNGVVRTSNVYQHNTGKHANGLTNNFDSTLELTILKDYSSLAGSKLLKLSDFITSQLGSDTSILTMKR